MADLNFPASPVDGQTYDNYIYVASKSVWQSIPGLPAGLLAGTIMGWGGSTAPNQWLICDGSAVSRSTYSALYAAIGTTYGIGDGSTTFNLPDLRGRIPVGKNSGSFGTLGATGGNETNTHQHFTLTSNDGTSTYITASGTVVSGSTPGSRVITAPRYQLGGGSTSGPTRQDATYDTTIDIVQPYQVINYIIKYAAAYVPQESELVPRVDDLESGVTNYILNGAFDIWQRGTSFTSPASSSYVADRWATNVPAVSTISRQSAGLAGFQYCMRVQRNSGQTTTSNFNVGQPFEIAEAIRLAGKTVNFSFYARAGANFSSSAQALGVVVSSGTGASELNRMSAAYTGDVAALNTSVTLTTSWQRFSLNVTFGSTVTQFMPYFVFSPTGTAGANDYFEVTGVQLQTGSTASSFRRNAPNIQAELVACQRYYITGSMGNTYYIGSGNGTGVGTHGFSFAPMRVAPTATVLVFTNSDNASNGGISVFSNSAVNGNFRNSNTAFPYYNFTATFKLEAEL